MQPSLERARLRLLEVALVLAFSADSTTCLAQGPPTQAHPEGLPKGINEPFDAPNVKEFISRFETESREVFARRKEIVGALALKPGMYLADVGAGTGLFTRLMAERVGPSGRVYAVDVADSFLKHIAEESKKLDQRQVRTIKGTQTNTFLPAAVIDVAFVCDVYHHVEQPAPWLASIHTGLKPGGRLVLIDFDKEKAKDVEFIRKHVRAAKSVFAREITAAGFERVDSPAGPEMKENFFLVFKRVEKPPAVVD